MEDIFAVPLWKVSRGYSSRWSTPCSPLLYKYAASLYTTRYYLQRGSYLNKCNMQYSPTILDPSLFLQRTICTLELAPGWPAKTFSTLLHTLRTDPLSMWNVRCRLPTSQLRPTAVRLQLPFLIKKKTLNNQSVDFKPSQKNLMTQTRCLWLTVITLSKMTLEVKFKYSVPNHSC